MKAVFVRSYSDPAQMPPFLLPQVALLGRSNAGKSSFINSITQTKDLAHSSAQPGKTKLINQYDIDRSYSFIDLPGYGYAKASKTSRQDLFRLVDQYIGTSSVLRLVIVLVDSRMEPTVEDVACIQHLQREGILFCIVANKVDKLSRAAQAQVVSRLEKQFPGIKVFLHSAVSGEGVGVLREYILGQVKGEK